jgi:hypothetical protein
VSSGTLGFLLVPFLRLKIVKETITYWGYSRVEKSEPIVPISAPGQNSRNEDHIQASITDRSLRHLTEFVAQGFQEGAINLMEDPPGLI